MKKLCFLLFALLCFSSAAQEVISPREGVWQNKPYLVLSMEDDFRADYFVKAEGSLNRKIPYNSPVMLGFNGKVSITVNFYKNNRFYKKQTVSYTAEGKNEVSQFIERLSKGIFVYTAGEKISVPKNFSFSFDGAAFRNGEELSLPASASLEHYAPLTLKDKDKFYLFIIKVKCAKREDFSSQARGKEKSLPFKIDSFKNIRFTSPSFTYKIDEGKWLSSRDKAVIDEKKAHTVYWKNTGNTQNATLHSHTLSPLEEIKTEKGENGDVFIKGGRDVYFSISGQSGFFKGSLFFTSFPDCYLEGEKTVNVFADGIYRGNIKVQYLINPPPPSPPVFKSGIADNFSRTDVRLAVEAGEGEEIYFYKAGPVITDESSATSPLLELYKADYQKYSAPIKIDAIQGKCAAYKILAYAEKGGKKSAVSEYFVAIDPYNYYISSLAKVHGTGTKDSPLKDFDSLVPLINSGTPISLHLLDNCILDDEVKVHEALFVKGENDKAALLLGKRAKLTSQGGIISLENMEIRFKGKADGALFSSDKGIFTLKQINLDASFEKSGEIFRGNESSFKILNSSFSASAASYTLFASCKNSTLEVKNSSINLSSVISFAFRLNGCTINMLKSSVSLKGFTGRVGEFFETKHSLKDSRFVCSFEDKEADMCPIYSFKREAYKYEK